MACSHRHQNILFFRFAHLDNELISNVSRKHNPKIEFRSTDSILECRKRVSLALEQTDYASEADNQNMWPKCISKCLLLLPFNFPVLASK